MSDTTRQIGRPKKAPAEQRTERLPGIRLTTAERHRIEQLADRRGVSVMEFCRRIILDQPLPVIRHQADNRALAELNRIGVNLNQIAFAANTGRLLEGKLSAALDELHAAIERLAGGVDEL